MHTTPVLFKNRLYLQLIHSGGAWVIAIDKATGKDVWKVERPSDGTDENEHSYASACMWSNGKDAYLVVHGNDYATAHRLSDGSEIWRLGDLNPRSNYNKFLRFVASPVATPELIVVPSAKNGPVVGVQPDAAGKIEAGTPFAQWRRPTTPRRARRWSTTVSVYLCRKRRFDLHGREDRRILRRTQPRALSRSPVYADGKLHHGPRWRRLRDQGRPKFAPAENKLPDQMSASRLPRAADLSARFEALYAIAGHEMNESKTVNQVYEFIWHRPLVALWWCTGMGVPRDASRCKYPNAKIPRDIPERRISGTLNTHDSLRRLTT